MSSTEFGRNPKAAKRQADAQPLVVTEYGQPQYVLLSYGDFQKNWKKPKSLLEALADPFARTD